MFKLSGFFGTDRSKMVLLLWIFFLLFVFRVCQCHSVFSVPCSLVVACWEMADLFALLCVFVFYHFPIWCPGSHLYRIWYLIVSIPDLCLIAYYQCGRHYELST